MLGGTLPAESKLESMSLRILGLLAGSVVYKPTCLRNTSPDHNCLRWCRWKNTAVIRNKLSGNGLSRISRMPHFDLSQIIHLGPVGSMVVGTVIRSNCWQKNRLDQTQYRSPKIVRNLGRASAVDRRVEGIACPSVAELQRALTCCSQESWTIFRRRLSLFCCDNL